MTLPPSGSGSPPVRSAHHSPRSTIFRRPFFLVRHLAFVNQQASRDLTSVHRFLDPVEGHDDPLHARVVETQGEERGRQFAGNGNTDTLERRGSALFHDDDGAVAIAHAGAVRQQDVTVRQVGVRVKGNRGDLVTSLERRAIQRFDIRQHMFQLESF